VAPVDAGVAVWRDRDGEHQQGAQEGDDYTHGQPVL
jgi:hypothetical protein